MHLYLTVYSAYVFGYITSILSGLIHLNPWELYPSQLILTCDCGETERLRLPHSLSPTFIELKAGVCLKPTCLYILWCNHSICSVTLEGGVSLLTAFSWSCCTYLNTPKNECGSWLVVWKITAWEKLPTPSPLHTSHYMHTCWVISVVSEQLSDTKGEV